MGGAVVIGGSESDPPGTEELQEAALDACTAQIGHPEWWVTPPDEAAYDRAVEAHACLVAHGVDLPEMAVREAWLDEAHPQFPHQALAMMPDIDDDTLKDLFEACPQPGARGLVLMVHGDDLLARAGSPR